jgi:hypothetical protein
MKIGLLCVLTVLAGDFAMLYINAIRQAFDELQQLKSATA